MNSPRGWFSKRPAQKDLSHSLSTEKHPLPLHVDVSKGPFKFNTFAAVIGKKPKKSSPAFHDQPIINTLPDRPHPVQYTNRPPSKSISSTVRSGDSSEPLTPSDVPKDRTSFTRSVFTLSDADPFAAGTISLPQGITDSTRLSVFSSTSGNDAFSKKNDPLLSFECSSFASTSSLSPVSSDVHDHTKYPPLPDPPQRCMAPLLENRCIDITPENASTERWDATIRPPLSKSSSFATLTDKTSSENHVPRIPTRPRGYTDSSFPLPTTASSHVPRKGSTQTDSQPLLPSLSRNLSASRLVTQPPTAPPVHKLPPTPLTLLRSDNGHEVSSTLSRSGSCVSSSGPNGPGNLYRTTRSPVTNDAGIESGWLATKKLPPRPKEPLRSSLADIFVQRPSPRSPILASHTLKKSMSHSTLQKLKVGDELNPPASVGIPRPSDRDVAKPLPPRPQSPSFPQTRQYTTLITSNPSSSETNLSAESKRSITNSPPVTVRRRLFSGSSTRRPSLVTTDDDSRSVFSLPTEAERAQGMTSLYAGSLWDEADSDAVPSGVISPTPDYAQRIMSPAEMLKVEAMVQNEFDSKYRELLRSRQRNTSFTSASTPPFTTMYTKEGLSTASTSFPRSKGSCSSGSSLSAAQPSMGQDPSPTPVSNSPSSPTGLSPPPRLQSRPRTSESQSDISGRRLSTLPANPLSPPPRKRTPRGSICADKAPFTPIIIRKPSFLEINDDAQSFDGSFLDLGIGQDSLDLSRDSN